MEDLLNIPRLTSYKSCIKFHNRSILPPLLSTHQKNEIEEIRKKTAIIEKRIYDKNVDKTGLTQKIQELLGKVEASRNLNVSEDSDAFKSLCGSTLPFHVASNTTLNGIFEDDEDISIISTSQNRADEIGNGNQTPILIDTSPESCPSIVNEESNQSSSAILPSELVTDYFGIQNFQKSLDASSKIDFSDSEGTECPSLITIIANDELNVSQNTDNNSIARSSDLEKYFDCSVEDVESSGQSTTLEQDIDLLLSFSSSETIVDCSTNSTPIVSYSLPLFEKKTNPIDSLLDFDITPDSPLSFVMPVESEFSNNIPSCVELLNNDSSILQFTPKKIIYEKNETKICDLPQPPGHKRSNSYTIEVPSPVLLESHANCPCLKSPTGSLKPHCSWVDTFGKDSCPAITKMSDVPVRCYTNPFSGSRDLNESESSKEKQSFPEAIQEAFQHKMVLEKLFEDFKKKREQRVELLLQEQHKQWEYLNQELAQQEEELHKQMSALNLSNNEDGEVSENLVSLDCSATKSEECQDVPGTKELDSNCLLLGSTYTLSPKMLADCSSETLGTVEPCPQEKPPTKDLDERSISKSELQHHLAVLEALNDPEMQKKFEKVSAVAKGFLTRRLLNSALVQKIKAKIVNTVMKIKSFHQRNVELILEAEDVIKYHGDLVLQLSRAFADIHYIFFETTPAERMNIIAESRDFEIRKKEKGQTLPPETANAAPVATKRKLSAATLKRLERKGLSNEKTGSKEKLWKNDDNRRLKKAASAKNISSQKKSHATAARRKSTSPPRSCSKNKTKRNCFTSAMLPYN